MPSTRKTTLVHCIHVVTPLLQRPARGCTIYPTTCSTDDTIEVICTYAHVYHASHPLLLHLTHPQIIPLTRWKTSSRQSADVHMYTLPRILHSSTSPVPIILCFANPDPLQFGPAHHCATMCMQQRSLYLMRCSRPALRFR